jgi:hypothetical protein
MVYGFRNIRRIWIPLLVVDWAVVCSFKTSDESKKFEGSIEEGDAEEKGANYLYTNYPEGDLSYVFFNREEYHHCQRDQRTDDSKTCDKEHVPVHTDVIRSNEWWDVHKDDRNISKKDNRAHHWGNPKSGFRNLINGWPVHGLT